jgi:hypothetical protein
MDIRTKLQGLSNHSAVKLLGSLEQTKFCSTQFDAVTGTTGTTLTSVVGLTSFELLAGETYMFELHLAGVATANCGHKVGFGLTTATLTSLESMAVAHTATAIAATHSTTATSAATLHGATSATIDITIKGRMVVLLGGTLDVQCAQNAAHADTTSVYVGSYMTLKRVITVP